MLNSSWMGRQKKLSLMDSKGKVVYETLIVRNFNGSTSLPDFIENGLYLVRLQNDQGSSTARMLLLRY